MKHEGLQFVSTRASDKNKHKVLNFTDAVFEGLAIDGGLYYPTKKSIEEVSSVLTTVLENLDIHISFTALVSKLTTVLFSKEFSADIADKIAYNSFSKGYVFEPKLCNLNDEIDLLELFHGPSCAFKDFGANYLAAVMEHRLEKENKQITIITATSGDTGSAVAQAFFKKRNINVVILYPSGRVSPLQEKQITGLGENIIALEVDGNFDDCQQLVKQAFSDKTLKEKYNLTSANSINIGRLIPQSFYYIYVWNKLRNSTSPYLFCTPSGNFGNISAGLLAWQLGLNVKKFIIATNANNVVPQYLESNIYTPRASIQTYANAMDVGDPSNFERIKYMFDVINVEKKLNDVLYGAWASDDDILYTMNDVQKKYGLYVCPHTAVGIYCAHKILAQKVSAGYYKKVIVLATAHAGKFFEVVKRACDVVPKFDEFVPSRLAQFLNKKKQAYFIPAHFSSLVKSLQVLDQ